MECIVIIPRIEYQMSGVILRKEEYDKLMININTLVKHSAGCGLYILQILLCMTKIYMV